MEQDFIPVNFIKDVLNTILIPGLVFNFQPGRSIHILNSLVEIDRSPFDKDKKWPLFAMMLPVTERIENGVYTSLTINRIVIATITSKDDTILNRFLPDGTFISILYPCYKAFMKALGQSPYTVGQYFSHEKMDNPGIKTVEGVTDYVDAIEILKLVIPLNNFQNC